jgi:hypothetical protein
MAEINVA